MRNSFLRFIRYKQRRIVWRIVQNGTKCEKKLFFIVTYRLAYRAKRDEMRKKLFFILTYRLNLAFYPF